MLLTRNVYKTYETTNAMKLTLKDDFIELKFTGYVNGEVFDSNDSEVLDKIQPSAKPQKTLVIIGEQMVVPGLDKELVGKELGKDYSVLILYKDGFGPRKKELVRLIPKTVFTAQNINPVAGMSLLLDRNLVRLISVSGARVLADFNNPLFGKDISYNFKIIRFLETPEERAETFFIRFFQFVPEFEIKESIIVKGPKILEHFVKSAQPNAQKLLGKDLSFELKLPKAEDEKPLVSAEKTS